MIFPILMQQSEVAMLEQILYFLICAFSLATILFSYLAYKERSKYKASISDKAIR